MHSFGINYYILLIFLFFFQVYFLDLCADILFFNEKINWLVLFKSNLLIPFNENFNTNLATLGNLLYVNQIDNLFLFGLVLLIALIGSF